MPLLVNDRRQHDDGTDTQLHVGADGEVQSATVSVDGLTIGYWQRGHRDVWAGALSDEDRVRRAVQIALGDHRMATKATARN